MYPLPPPSYTESSVQRPTSGSGLSTTTKSASAAVAATEGIKYVPLAHLHRNCELCAHDDELSDEELVRLHRHRQHNDFRRRRIKSVCIVGSTVIALILFVTGIVLGAHNKK